MISEAISLGQGLKIMQITKHLKIGFYLGKRGACLSLVFDWLEIFKDYFLDQDGHIILGKGEFLEAWKWVK